MPSAHELELAETPKRPPPNRASGRLEPSAEVGGSGSLSAEVQALEAELRNALAQDPQDRRAGSALARLLGKTGRGREAGDLLRAQARLSEAPTADLDMAEAFYAAELEEEAEATCRRRLQEAGEDVRARLLLARVLQGQHRLEAAEIELRAAIHCDPTSASAHRELAQLIWMRTGSSDLALAAVIAAPRTPALAGLAARVLEDAGRAEEAYRLVAAATEIWPALHLVAAKIAVAQDPRRAEAHLLRLPPNDAAARATAEIEVDLALGRGGRAARRAEALRAARPGDHYVTALMATAWRLLGDPRYGRLYDYDRLVSVHRLPAPPGWATREAYLEDLGAALDAAHGPRLTHPIGQSVRGGGQTFKDLRAYPAPAIGALFKAIDAPIRRRLEQVGGGGYAVSGAWSVRLDPEGHHIDHVHAEGWLSSAFYVRVPKGLSGAAGALKFGEPGPRTSPRLGPERLLAPEPGLLVLFPSYMWHGVAPFAGEGDRLSCAFDIVRRRDAA